MEIAKFVVCIKEIKVLKYMYIEVFSSIEVSINPDIEVSLSKYLSVRILVACHSLQTIGMAFDSWLDRYQQYF